MRGEYTPRASARCLRSELPPRARRIRLTTSFTGLNAGTTSACAENTHPAAASRRLAWNYLRMRGEYLKTGEIAKGDLELPPRARRIQQRRSMGHPQMGTTSTCAENTSVLVDLALDIGNYLRVRGEYIQAFRHGCGNEELPPRARRIPGALGCAACRHGTTSACAENTQPGHAYMGEQWNYLRVRGEYHPESSHPASWGELPPRARRIHNLGMPIWESNGTTSACAENTVKIGQNRYKDWNYLRVRGEYHTCVS